MEPTPEIAAAFRQFADVEVRGKSALYEELCRGVSEDGEILGFLAQLPNPNRQPNLLLAAVRFLFGTPAGYGEFRDHLLQSTADVEAVILSRRTQTNEPGRCAALLPILAQLPEPLALLEVGASAGLCLLPDHYGYDYGGKRVGPDEVVFECSPHGGVPLPDRVPEVVWRAGIDLEPPDIDDAEDTRWLEALIWPEEKDRLERFQASLAIARREHPKVVQGDLRRDLASVAEHAPTDATLVIFHSAVLSYVSANDRDEFVSQVKSLDAEWVSNEGEGVVETLPSGAPAPLSPSRFLMSWRGEVQAACDPHGRWVQWLR